MSRSSWYRPDGLIRAMRLGLGGVLGSVALLVSGCVKPQACGPCSETPAAEAIPNAAEPFWTKYTEEDVRRKYHQAMEDYSAGRYDEAFEGYRWLYEHALEIEWFGFAGVLYSDVPHVLASMAQKGHPQSRKYTSMLVDKVEAEIRSGYPARTYLYVALCRELHQNEQVLDLYEELRADEGARESVLEELGKWSKDAALEEGRYDLYLSLPEVTSREFRVHVFHHFADRGRLVKAQIERLGVLVKVGRQQEAREALHELYCFDASPETKSAIASSVEGGLVLPELPENWRAECPDMSKDPSDEEEPGK